MGAPTSKDSWGRRMPANARLCATVIQIAWRLTTKARRRLLVRPHEDLPQDIRVSDTRAPTLSQTLRVTVRFRAHFRLLAKPTTHHKCAIGDSVPLPRIPLLALQQPSRSQLKQSQRSTQ